MVDISRHGENKMNNLNEIELRLKQLSNEYPDLFHRATVSQEELTPIWHQIQSLIKGYEDVLIKNDLTEELFFRHGQDIAIISHLRYLPPLLHSHTFFEIILVKNGICSNAICGQTIHLEAGDICVIAPGVEHAIFTDSDSAQLTNILVRTSTFATTFQSLMSDRDVLSIFFYHALFSKSKSSYLIFKTDKDSNIQSFLHFIETEADADERYKNRMLNVLFQTLIIAMLRRHDGHVVFPPSPDKIDSSEFMEMIAYIQIHYADLSLPMLSEHCGYSERHTSRLIRNYTGMSFSVFIRTIKLRHAADYLANSNLSISEVFDVVGYSDMSSFHRAFKKTYGMTPAEYRLNIKKIE